MDIMECPFCTGEIPERAQKCKHCGEWIQEPPTSRQAINVTARSISSADLVRQFVPRMETLLKNKFGAQGTGLVQQMISVSHLIPDNLQSLIRWIGGIRNEVSHSETFEIEDRELFASRCQKVISALETLSIERGMGFPERPAYRQIFAQDATTVTAIAAGIVLIIALSIFPPKPSNVSTSNATVSKYPGKIFSSLDNTTTSGAIDKPLMPQELPTSTTVVTQFKKGALMEESTESSQEFQAAQKEIERKIWGHLKKKTKIIVGKPSMRETGKDNYDLLVVPS
jgi:hypothetical protein